MLNRLIIRVRELQKAILVPEWLVVMGGCGEISRFLYILHGITLSLLLACPLLFSGCLQVRLHTVIYANGSTLRRLDISVDEQYSDQLQDQSDTEMAVVSETELWDSTTYVRDGRFHRVFKKKFSDVESMSDRMIHVFFGKWVRLETYRESEKVEFDIYRTFSATTYTFQQSLQIYPNVDTLLVLYGRQVPPVRIEISVDMPGKLLESPGALVTEDNALWRFSISPQDTSAFGRCFLVKSGRSHFWSQFLIGVLVILFVVYLPRQFLRLRSGKEDDSRNQTNY